MKYLLFIEAFMTNNPKPASIVVRDTETGKFCAFLSIDQVEQIAAQYHEMERIYNGDATT